MEEGCRRESQRQIEIWIEWISSFEDFLQFPLTKKCRYPLEIEKGKEPDSPHGTLEER